jgi:hypothetical protein
MWCGGLFGVVGVLADRALEGAPLKFKNEPNETHFFIGISIGIATMGVVCFDLFNHTKGI